ncbi:dnaJ homolog subfamily C member 22-like [Liolophura sinensis]|uniref:dnaJ homolog subfamily C member 22-like n=1 Tax=Liolophura sinensis TaxID=3198878 RepID=UPI003158F83D
MDGDKDVGIAYFLWLIGGAFGLHHLYLGRDRQAFVWWATWGGFFGIGWLRDIFNIPYYVSLANQSYDTVELAKNEERFRVRPQWSTARFCGEIMFGFRLGYVLQYAIPVELLYGNSVLSDILLLIGPFGTAIGVHVVANIGREQCSWHYPVLGAYIAAPLIYLSPTNLLFCGITSAVAASGIGSRWRPIGQLGVRRKKHVCKRLPYLTVCGLAYLSLWGSMIYFNATMGWWGGGVEVVHTKNIFFVSNVFFLQQQPYVIFEQLYYVGVTHFYIE